VRDETVHADTQIEGARATLLARGSIERILMMLERPAIPQPGRPVEFEPGQQRVLFRYPEGDVLLELRPESGKIGINSAPPALIASVLIAAGHPPEQCRVFAGAIATMRAASTSAVSPFGPTFSAPAASFKQIEDALLVPGMTLPMFYGGSAVVPGDAVVRRAGFRDLFSIYGTVGIYDANSAHPVVLAAAGLSPIDIGTITSLRARMQIRQVDLQNLLVAGGPANRVLRVGDDFAYTIAATARPRTPQGNLSSTQRSVSLLVRMEQQVPGFPLKPIPLAWQSFATTDLPWPGAAQ